MDRSEFLIALNAALNVPIGRPALVCFVDFEWQMEFGSDRPHGTVIIETTRPLTTGGGDGWTGFDAQQMQTIHDAAMRVLIDDGTVGLWDRLIVRQSTGHMTRHEVNSVIAELVRG